MVESKDFKSNWRSLHKGGYTLLFHYAKGKDPIPMPDIDDPIDYAMSALMTSPHITMIHVYHPMTLEKELLYDIQDEHYPSRPNYITHKEILEAREKAKEKIEA